MTNEEKKRHLTPKNKGFLLSEKWALSLDDSFRNIAVIAPSGGGKTLRTFIGNILKCPGSMAITDPSGEIEHLTSGYLKKRGYQIQRLALANPLNSLRYNPLKRRNTKQELKQLAETLCLNTIGRSGNSDPFWLITPINMIYLIFLALKNHPDPNFAHLLNARKLINGFAVIDERSGHSRTRKFMETYLEDEDFEEYERILTYDNKLLTSIVASAAAALDLWTDPDVVQITSNDNLDLTSLRDKKTVIYINIPQDKIDYYSLLANLFYSDCFEICIKNPNGEPVFYFLDEFANLGIVNNFDTIITTIRKYRCCISVIIQGFSQLKDIYGIYKAETILHSGISHKIYFSGIQEAETLDYVSRMLGNITVYDNFWVELFKGFSERSHTVAKPLMSPDEIRIMNDEMAIIISKNRRPMYIRMPWYSQVTDLVKFTQNKPIKVDYGNQNKILKIIDLKTL